MVEITSEEQNKVKRMQRTEEILRDLGDNIKCTNIRIFIGVPEEEKKKEYEKIFEEIIVENFPNMGKGVSHEVRRRGQWASRGAPRKSGLHASGEGERVIAPEPW